jgi:hypothetical protein
MHAALAVLLFFTPAKLEKKYPKPNTIEKFTGYQIAGLTLWHVVGLSANDRNGDSFVVGLDAQEGLVLGAELFRRAAPGLSPADQARRTFDILLARAGGVAFDPATDKKMSMFPDADWAMVRAPAVENGVLTFWTTVGEMHPEIARVQVTLATGQAVVRNIGEVRYPPEKQLADSRDMLHAADKVTILKGLGRVDYHRELRPDVEALMLHADAEVRNRATGIITSWADPLAVPALIGVLQNGPTADERTLAGVMLLDRFGGPPEGVAAVRAYLAKGGTIQEIYSLREALREWDEKHKK